MELNAFQSLLRPQGQEALRAAAVLSTLEVDFLRHYQALARQFPPELARAALETATLRVEASTIFPASGKMYYTRKAMEQASPGKSPNTGQKATNISIQLLTWAVP